MHRISPRQDIAGGTAPSQGEAGSDSGTADGAAATRQSQRDCVSRTGSAVWRGESQASGTACNGCRGFPAKRQGTGLGAEVSRKSARVDSRGRVIGDGHLPSASQSIHFPNLLFSYPLHHYRVLRGRTSGQNALGLGIKIHHNLRCDYQLPVLSGNWLKRNVLRVPSGQLPVFSCPSRACRLLLFPERNAGLPRPAIQATGPSGSGKNGRGPQSGRYPFRIRGRGR